MCILKELFVHGVEIEVRKGKNTRTIGFQSYCICFSAAAKLIEGVIGNQIKPKNINTL